MNVFFALLHYPVYNKNREHVVTTVTNTDLHDLSRLAKTYDISRYFVVTPLKTQLDLVQRLVKHWTEGYGSTYNETRKDAVEILSVVSSYNCVIGKIMLETGKKPFVIATSARSQQSSVSYAEMRDKMNKADTSFLILFGTGWGLPAEILDRADCILDPIHGRKGYNHLSVRCAAAIVMDRLLGT